MGYYAKSLILQCDVGGSGCRRLAEFENEDQLSYSMLIAIAEQKGWYVPSGGKTLCPNCMATTAKKYQVKLAKEGPRPRSPHLKSLSEVVQPPPISTLDDQPSSPSQAEKPSGSGADL